MPNGNSGLVTYEAFCSTCEEERRVMRTVPWQDDVCVTCGSNVESDAPDVRPE